MADKKTVYTNFVPSSSTLAPLAADYVKASDMAQKALEKVRAEAFNVLHKAGKIDKASEDAFRVGRRWGQWSWWIATTSEKKSDGMDL